MCFPQATLSFRRERFTRRGTLPRGKANNDPNAPGGIGKYLARGVFTTDFANFEKAVDGLPGASPEVGFATEIYSFHEDGTSIMTDGIWPNSTLFCASGSARRNGTIPGHSWRDQGREHRGKHLLVSVICA